jgi:uncharacterized small protein (DUF1192 family)
MPPLKAGCGRIQVAGYDKQDRDRSSDSGTFMNLVSAWQDRNGKGDGMAVDDIDDIPVKRRRLEPLVLDTLGVEELRAYIGELRAEIARVEADIERKQSHRSAADTFFRRP